MQRSSPNPRWGFPVNRWSWCESRCNAAAFRLNRTRSTQSAEVIGGPNPAELFLFTLPIMWPPHSWTTHGHNQSPTQTLLDFTHKILKTHTHCCLLTINVFTLRLYITPVYNFVFSTVLWLSYFYFHDQNQEICLEKKERSWESIQSFQSCDICLGGWTQVWNAS